MKKPDEYVILERAHEAAGAHMMQKSPRADELIACLEGEIAKRDARIVELESDLAGTQSRVLSLQDQWRKLDAELAALKAQDTVGEVVGWYRLDRPYEMTSYPSVCATWYKLGAPVAPLYAAPVSEAKAQGVVMPERLKPSRYELHDAAVDAWNSCLDEVARLNAAPVQQVGVPTHEMIMAGEDQWERSGNESPDVAAIFLAMLAASPAAPAADAGMVLEQAMYTLISIGYHENSGLVHELRQALAAHRSTGVV